MNFGANNMVYERIRQLREDKDLSQAYLAKMLNVNQRTYSRYENGEYAIPLDMHCFLADFHHVSVDYLLNRTNTKAPYPISKKSNI